MISREKRLIFAYAIKLKAMSDFSIEAYDALVKDIFDRHPSVQSVGFSGDAYKPGLDGMKRFDEALGSPWRSYECFHIAGTNGKGSVSSMLAAALAGRGLKVGLYTSPHLVDFRERVKTVSGGSYSMVSREFVYDFLRNAPTEGLSFFEITTGLAFAWFKEAEVDAAVIETGLGGRLDSTNIITPRISIITSIGLDHCAMLGHTREAIAGEKAGIFKHGVPALAGVRDDETAPVFERQAQQVGCPLHYADEFPAEDFQTDLRGPYQRGNLRTALAALKILGIPAEKDAISCCGRATGFRGRWEQVLDSPQTICDIGHNPEALKINFARIKESARPLFIVYGIMSDKDLAAIRPMMPAEARYYLVAPAIRRSLPVEELDAACEGLKRKAFGSVALGVEAALQDASKIPGSLVYVGGSNFVVAECISYLGQKKTTE